MKNGISFLLTAFVFCITVTFNANSQIAISNIAEIEKIKSGTTYIVMSDPDSENVEAYINVFKNYWTISEIEFIKYSEIEEFISPENSFLTMGGYETNRHSVDVNQNGVVSSVNYTNTHLYLELWTCDEKYFQSNNSENGFGNDDKIQVARIELFTDFATLSDPDKLFQSDYGENSHIRNWGPGILKNYIQSLMTFFNKGKDHSLYSSIYNTMEIKKLKNEVLYVPEYVLTKFNKFTGDETKKHEEKDIFKKYKLKYKLSSTEELNQKILSDNTSFYYLIYIKSSTDKYISVINALTGEIIYSKYKPVSYNIKSSDLKDLRNRAK